MMKVFCSSKFLGVRFPRCVYANSLPARIPFFQLFLSFSILLDFVLFAVRLFLCIPIIIFSLPANGCQDTLLVFASRASSKVLFVHPDIYRTSFIHPTKTVSTTTLPYIMIHCSRRERARVVYRLHTHTLTYIYILYYRCAAHASQCAHTGNKGL